MLVIAPVAILTISAVIVAIIALSGSSMRSQAITQLQNDVLAALDRMEQDVRLSDSLTVSGSDLEMVNLATDKNPFNEDRKLIRASDCSVMPDGIVVANALNYDISYKASGSGVVREVVLPSGCASTSSNVWQENSSEKLIDGADSTMVVHAFGTDAVSIELTAKKTVAGQEVSFTGTMYAKSIN
ncbi:hypothetical protein CR969_02690 [Candidatus Saccharibacteria bacterium]|nr:MAG: hypothetical protein CR969_02690 [Candidatus Saccharibacteria bacterium]